MRIKCPHCNGKGFSEINSALNLTCGWCMGKGELDIEAVPAKENMTNEEWFCELPTKDKAKWLSQRSQILYDCGQRDVFPKIMYEEDWELWLKQPHTFE